jgi:hypothetical protein
MILSGFVLRTFTSFWRHWIVDKESARRDCIPINNDHWCEWEVPEYLWVMTQEILHSNPWLCIDLDSFNGIIFPIVIVNDWLQKRLSCDIFN